MSTHDIDLVRRRILRSSTLLIASPLAFSPIARAAIGDTSTVEVTEGPYWLDAGLNRADIRADTGTGDIQDGFPLLLSVNVSTLDTASGATVPLTGAYVDIWHCNALGLYSGIATNTNQGQSDYDYLRGYQATDLQGKVRFRTIYPGWYAGRATHIHVRVRTFSGAETTLEHVTQFAFDDDMSTEIYTNVSPYTQKGENSLKNTADQVFTGTNSCVDAEIAGDSLHLLMTRRAKYVSASFNIMIDPNARCTSSETGGGGAGGPGGMPPGGMTPPGMLG